MAFVSIGCNVCGNPVSKGFESPEGFEIAAWVECANCMATKGPDIVSVIGIIASRLMRPQFCNSNDAHKRQLIEAAARDIVQSLNNKRFQNGS